MRDNQPMRVLFLTPFLSYRGGGVSTSVLHLAQTLALQDGVDVDVLSVEQRCPDAELAAWSPLRPINLPPRGPAAFGFSPALENQLTALRPDIVHCHGLWTYSSLACLRWSRREGRPFMVTPHGMLDSWALQNSRWKKRLAGLLFQKRHLRAAACLHALCRPEADSVRALGLRNPLCVIPNGIGLPTVSPREPPAWSRLIPVTDNVLLFLGRLHPKKGLAGLLRAWAGMPATTVRWHLAIAGWDDGGHEADFRKLANELGVGRVHFIGPQLDGDKAATFARANAFVLPSLSEGLPMTILEAWSYGKPVVMTAECNLPEGFQADAAIRVTPDAEGIGQGLRQLSEMGVRDLEEMGRRGRMLVENRFSWTDIARQMSSVYRWILGLRPEPPPAIVR